MSSLAWLQSVPFTKYLPVTADVQQMECIYSHWQIGLFAWFCSCWPAMLYGLLRVCQLKVPAQALPRHKMDWSHR